MRPAPIDRRIAISRCRAAARASSRPARFAHAISSTMAATAIRTSSTGRSTLTPPVGDSTSETTMRLRSDVPGFLSLIARNIGVSSVRACSIVTPGASRPRTVSHVDPRSSQAIAAGHDRRLTRHRHPPVELQRRFASLKSRRRHADDGEGLCVELHSLADHGVRSAEARGPVVVTDHRDGFGAGRSSDGCSRRPRHGRTPSASK